MHPFANQICLRILDRCQSQEDPMSLQHLLKCKTSEFSSLVVDAFDWPRITRQPVVLKDEGNMCQGFVLDPNDFCQVSHRIYDGEC